MKGIILSEFVEYLELELGESTTQQIIDQSDLSSDGAYSRVGMYDYQELIRLLTNTCTQSDRSADELLDGFSNHLFSMFKRDYSMFFDGVENAAQMLMQIDNHIHVEVKKLYPDAELPTFNYTQNANQLTLNYTSPRPLAVVAQALVKACITFFGQNERLTNSEISEDQKSATFTIETIST